MPFIFLFKYFLNIAIVLLVLKFCKAINTDAKSMFPDIIKKDVRNVNKTKKITKKRSKKQKLNNVIKKIKHSIREEAIKTVNGENSDNSKEYFNEFKSLLKKEIISGEARKIRYLNQAKRRKELKNSSL